MKHFAIISIIAMITATYCSCKTETKKLTTSPKTGEHRVPKSVAEYTTIKGYHKRILYAEDFGFNPSFEFWNTTEANERALANVINTACDNHVDSIVWGRDTLKKLSQTDTGFDTMYVYDGKITGVIFMKTREHAEEVPKHPLDFTHAGITHIGNGFIEVDGRRYTNWNTVDMIKQINRTIDSIYYLTKQ